MTQVPFSNTAAPAPMRPSALAGTPTIDWIRDGAAVVLLLVSLAMPWSFSLESGAVLGARHTEVILITILSVLSVAMTYLARFGVLGAGASLSRIVGLRAALNAPYVILVLVYVILDGVGSSVGLGGGAVLGLSGALLAAGTREFEMRDQNVNSPVVRASYAIVAITSVVLVVTSLIGVIIPVAADAGFDSAALTTLVAPIVEAVGVVVLFALVLRRSGTARLVGCGIGFAVLATVIIDALSGFVLSGSAFGLESLRAGGYPTLWLAAAGAMLSAPSVRLAMKPVAPLTAWFTTARQSFLLIAIVGGVLTVFDVFAVIFSDGMPIGLVIAVLLCHILAIVAALIGRTQLIGDPAGSRLTVIGIASGIAVLAIVAVVVGSIARTTNSVSLNSRYGLLGYPGSTLLAPLTWTLAGLLGLAVVVAFSLLLPSTVREYYAQVAGSSGAPASGGYPVATRSVPAPVQASTLTPAPVPITVAVPTPAPVPTPVPDPTPAVPSEEARRAADPATPAAELHEYAADRTLWPSLAANPALYPDLRHWLEATGDPEVLAILRAGPS